MLQGPGVTLALVMAAVAATVTVTAGQVVIAQETSAVTQRALFKRLTSKLQLLEKLLQGSSLAKRIERSGNSQAEALLATARKSLVQSEEELYAGQYEAAEAAANQGINAVTTASRMVVDRRYEEAGDRERYQQLRKRVLSFTEAFQRVVIEKQGQDIDGLLDQKKVGELLLDAEGLVQKGNYAMANQRMTEAADAVEHALSRARDKETLLHELKFDTPVDEYNYEKQRNKSYELLVDILEKERKGKGLEDVRAAIELNRRRRAEADELVDGGDVVAAIRTLEEGTENLARALRRSGLAF